MGCPNSSIERPASIGRNIAGKSTLSGNMNGGVAIQHNGCKLREKIATCRSKLTVGAAVTPIMNVSITC
jgi:hypothetical protein